jgi:hypothetical protein
MMTGTVDPTITVHVVDRELKRVLAGVFEATPLELFVHLGGRVEEYDDEARRMMRWHLRSLGYEETETRPLCWSPPRVVWRRRHRWPEDAVWIKGDLNAILDHIDTVCD